MKKIVLLLSLLVCLVGSVFAKHKYDFLEGKYGNRYYDVEIKVKSIDGGVKVKGIPGHRGWKKFFMSRHNTLRESHGNHRLVIIGRYSIDIQHGRWGKPMRFIRKDNRKNYHGYYWNDRRGEYYQRDRDYRYNRDYDWDDRRRDRERDDGYDRRFEKRFEDISGEWYSEDLRKLVIIKNDGSGFKARLSGSQRWTKYIRGSSGSYVDDRGNAYYLENRDTLIWEDKNRRNRYILSRS